ncbi:MAG: oligoendopeptidase F family protein [Elusimicrobia bacterium]|nr:oligoendopeptidase F family protein [Elusimicrobiota bacterium]
MTTPLLVILAAAAFAAPYKPDANAPRASVPQQYRWDLSPYFVDDAAWDKGFVEAKQLVSGLAAFQGKLAKPAGLRAALEAYFAARQAVSRASAYANLKADGDDSDAAAQERLQQSLDLSARFRSESGFIRQELLKLGEPAAAKLLAAKELEPYRAYIQDLRRRRKALLGDEAEKVLALAGDNLWSETDLNEIPSDVELAFKAVLKDLQLPSIKDEKGKPVQLTLANYAKYRSSKDRRVRADAVAGLFGSLKKYEDILAATLGGEAKRDVFLARARGYPRSLDAYLDRQDVPPAVVENLVASVRANLAPLHRYLALRQRMLKVKELRFYDLYAPLVPAADAEVPYEEGLKDALAAVAPMGPAYAAALSGPEMLGRRMIDVYPNKGKESGGFMQSLWGFPPFVKLNYMDRIDDVSTLAHELGHAMHSLINNKANADPDAGYPSLTAEVASTFQEVMLSRSLLKKYEGDKKMRLHLLSQMADRIRGTVYRQTLFTEFELKLHALAEAGTPITAALLDRTYADLVKTYYGPGFTIGKDDGVEWSYVPHFYWKHYVFSYACGLASAVALADRVGSGDVAARDRYLAMLAQPREAHPVAALKAAGVDLLSPDAIAAAARELDRVTAEMEKLAD